ncbi:MAG: DUF4091 domain-containing protein [Planctomycetes bacterium]|nr:DUF4091 domain-containing protein [Planctomycetota bacterium]
MNRRIFIATGVFCMFAAVASPAIAEDVLLMDFEKGGDFLAPRVDPNDLTTKPSCSAAINANWATQGKSSAQITLSQYQLGMPEWPGINLVAGRDFSVTDWSRFGQFALDIKNDCNHEIRVAVELRHEDKNGFTQAIDIAPNAQDTVLIDLQRAWKKSQFPIDMTRISQIIIYSTRPKEDWKYSIDNMRLLDNKKAIESGNKAKWAKIAIGYIHDAKTRDALAAELDAFVAAVDNEKFAGDDQRDAAFDALMQKIMDVRYKSDWFFNFGPQAGTEKGWKHVSAKTAFSDETGFGWVDQPALSEKAFEAVTAWGLRQSTPHVVSKQAPPIFMNEQQTGFVFSRNPATFRAVLPNGDYRVLLITGYPGEDTERFCPVDMTAGIQGRPHRITLAERKAFKTHIFDAAVKDNTLTVNFSTNSDHHWLVNAIAVWPVEMHDRAWSEYVSPLRDQITIMPEQLRAELLDDQRVKPAPRDNVPAEYVQHGFAPFVAQQLDDHTAAYTPASYGIDAGLSTRTAKNEIATMTFGLLPLADAPFHLTITPSDLKGEGGSIAADAVRVRMIENRGWAPDVLRKKLQEWPKILRDPYEGAWQWRPWEAAIFYVTVKLPEGTAAGNYEGVLNIAAGDKKPLTVPVKLTVLPVELKLDDDYTYSAYWYWFVEKSEARVRAEFRNMRDHGFNMGPTWRVSIKGAIVDGKAQWTIGKPDKIVDILREYGMLRSIPMAIETHVRWAMKELHNVVPIKCPVDVPLPIEFYDNITSLVAELEAWTKANNLPQVYYYTMDEICDYRLAKKLGDAVKKVPGAKLFSNSNPIIQAQLGDMVDLACYSYGGFTSEEKLAEEIKGRKSIAWTYPNDSLSCPRVGTRMLWGLTGRKIGFKGLWPWAYDVWTGSPNSPYDGFYPDYVFVYGDVDGPIDTVCYEEARCGIDDGRYYDTAEAMIAKLKAKGSPEALALASEAQEQLRAIMNEVSFRYLDAESQEYGRKHCMQWRSRLQDIVLRLNQAMEQ